jgi:hypothetical protein
VRRPLTALREEKEREDELHAFQSGEPRTRGTSKGLVVEQLWFLFDRKSEFVPAESALEAEGETLKGNATSRTLLESEGMRHPSNVIRGSNGLRCDLLMRRAEMAERKDVPPRVRHPPAPLKFHPWPE